MSADNWTTCPRCSRRRADELSAEHNRVTALYGAVPVEDFDRERADLEAKEATPLEETLREDYEFYGADEGVVSVRYSCSCGVCGLAFEISEDRPIPGIVS